MVGVMIRQLSSLLCMIISHGLHGLILEGQKHPHNLTIKYIPSVLSEDGVVAVSTVILIGSGIYQSMDLWVCLLEVILNILIDVGRLTLAVGETLPWGTPD